MSPTCEICESQEDCLAGRCPCDLCGEFIADVPRATANVMLAKLQAQEMAMRFGGMIARWRTDWEKAPTDRPLIAICRDGCAEPNCAYSDLRKEGDEIDRSKPYSLCLFHAHAEGLSAASAGLQVIVWGGGFADSWEDGGAELPDWWFKADSEFEVAANPVCWLDIPMGFF